jgi:hypothetical protein
VFFDIKAFDEYVQVLSIWGLFVETISIELVRGFKRYNAR